MTITSETVILDIYLLKQLNKHAVDYDVNSKKNILDEISSDLCF